MKNIKFIILGALIGVTATLSITALAELIANPNPYPVKVNGEIVQIEGYNINDSTYFKIRDVAAAIGGIDVDFVDGAVTIKTVETTPEPTATPAPTPEPTANIAQPTPNPKLSEALIDYTTSQGMEFTSDGLPIYVLEDGNKYVKQSHIKDVYNFKNNGYEFGVGRLYKGNDIVIDNMPIAPNNIKNNSIYTPTSYYENTFLPWLKLNCQ